jgi:hypothetical protein
LVLVAGFAPALAAAQVGGWIKAGGNPNEYEMGTDPKVAFTGTSSGYIKSAVPKPGTFGTYMQMIDAAEYRGKRVRMTAQVRTQDVQDWAGLWMRVDLGQKPTAFDNMQNRPLKGTTDWVPVSIVLDVDAKATGLAFGILLAGRGAAWIDDLTFNVVGPEVPTTSILNNPAAPPSNLDFETSPAAR